MLRKIAVSLAATLAIWVWLAPAVYAAEWPMGEGTLEMPADNAWAAEGPLEEGTPEAYDCRAVLLMEPESGKIIFENNGDERRQVASVNKIMTILLVIEALEEGKITLEEQVTVSEYAASMGGSQALLDAGERQSVEALLRSCIVGSANDSAVALAEHLAGSVGLFVEKMNRRAREMGMEDTCFVNATGLPGEGQYTTARDVGRMAAELSKKALFYDYSRIWLEDFVHESGRVTQLTNTNRLIQLYEGCDGLKTGSTNEAGYCMAATARRGGMRLIAVVLGAETGRERFDIASAMLDYGFAAYRVYPVAEKGVRVRGEMRVEGGDRESIPLYLGENMTLLMRKGEEGNVTLKPCLPEAVEAPVKAGERVGSVDIYMEDRLVGRVMVAAGEDAQRQSFSDGALRLWKRWRMGG